MRFNSSHFMLQRNENRQLVMSLTNLMTPPD